MASILEQFENEDQVQLRTDTPAEQRKNLPIFKQRSEIIEAIRKNQVSSVLYFYYFIIL